MARQRVVTRGRSIRRLTTWLQFQVVQSTLATGASTLVFGLNAAAEALRPFTIVRSHFMFLLRSDQSAAVEHQVAAWGIAVVSDQASAIGVTAVPTPLTDLASPLWFLHQLVASDESEVVDKTRPQQVKYVDSKAMRKVEIGQDVVIVVENAALDGIIATVAGRMLIKNN